MQIDKIKKLLLSNQKENDLIAYKLLQTQLNWSIKKSIYYGIKVKVKQLQQIQEINYYIENLHIKINHELDNSSGFEDWFLHDDLSIDLELYGEDKKLDFTQLAYVQTIHVDDELEEINPFQYKKKIIQLLPQITSLIFENFDFPAPNDSF